MFVSGSRARTKVSATAPAYLRNIGKASAEKNLASSTFSLCTCPKRLGDYGEQISISPVRNRPCCHVCEKNAFFEGV